MPIEEQKAGFTVVDKRGANNPVQDRTVDTPPVQNLDSREAKSRKWTSTAFMIITAKHYRSGEAMIAGRACGLADDENCFVADYVFGQRWEQGFDWTVDAKRRLDTFLTCTCDPRTGPCQFHYRMAPRGWVDEDIARIQEDGHRIVPKVVEVLSKAEQSRNQAQRILSPRR